MRRRLAVLLFAVTVIAPAQTPAVLLPTAVAYDAAGNLYFADTNRNQVFESTLAGQLLVVAGTGVQGFAGDGGTAVSAELNSPEGVAIGADGTLYIADTGNQRIRSVAAGQIATFAGTGKPGYGGDGGPATAASLSHPTALAVDAAGALLVCDTRNQRVRRIAGGVVSTIAGTGAQGFAGDGGAATAALLDTPSGVAVAADGRIFIADTHNHRVRVMSTAGAIMTFAGTGTAGYSGDGGAATAARLASPRGLTMTSTALLIADSNNQRIRSVDAQGNITTLAGNGTQGSSADAASGTAAALNTPRAVALSAFAAPVFADAGNRLVRELLGNGNLYLPAGLEPGRASTLSLNALPGAVLGQPIATVTVQGSAGVPQGTVNLLEAGSVVSQAKLVNGTASFSSSLLAAGPHTLTAAYLGDGVNAAAVSAAVSTVLGRAASVTTETTPQMSYAGLPLVLTANVTSPAQGVATGVVTFNEAGVAVATGTLSSSGVASGVYSAPTVGTHAIVANYAGDANFGPSHSAAVSAVVAGLPDFTLASTGSATQTVQYGSTAVYNFVVAAQPAPFSGAVSLSVSGLPSGVTAAFAPPQVVPGSSASQVTLSLQIPATLGSTTVQNRAWLALLLPLCILCGRRRLRRLPAVVVLTLALLSASGCGDRTLSEASQASRTFALTVAGTGTNLAGNAVMHATAITLIVD